MAKEHAKQEEESGGEGAPLWMISFADMSSLLMAFFLMLTTFSSFGPREEKQLKTVLRVATSPFGDLLGHGAFESSGDDLSRSPGTNGVDMQSNQTRTFTRTKGALRPTTAPDFQTHKVFTAESRDMYWSTGTSLSANGRTFLDTVANYAARLHGPVVVSESGPVPDNLGVQRSIAVVRYLVDHGIPEASINVAAAMLQPPTGDDHSSQDAAGRASGAPRRLQVTFLAGAIRE
jgi:hypothetical protein